MKGKILSTAVAVFRDERVKEQMFCDRVTSANQSKDGNSSCMLMVNLRKMLRSLNSYMEDQS